MCIELKMVSRVLVLSVNMAIFVASERPHVTFLSEANIYALERLQMHLNRLSFFPLHLVSPDFDEREGKKP